MNQETLLRYARREARALKNALNESQRKNLVLKNITSGTSVYDVIFTNTNSNAARTLKQRVSATLLNSRGEKSENGYTPLELLMRQNSGNDYNYQIAEYVKSNKVTKLPMFRNINVL